MSKITVKAKKNPFKSDIETVTVENGSLKEIYAQLHTGLPIAHARFMADGVIICDFDFIPSLDASVTVLVVPQGSTQDMGVAGKVAGWALIAVGIIISIVTWGTASPIGAMLIGTGVGMAIGGTVLLNINIPTFKSREPPQQDPSIKGSKNRMNQGGYVPFLLGRHLVFPDIAATPYTIVEGGAQYLVQLFCCGFNDMHIDTASFKIGDTKLAEYCETKIIDNALNLADKNVKLEVITNGANAVLYPEKVTEIQMNAQIKHSHEGGGSGAIIKTTVLNTTKINLDIFFYSGLGQYNDKGDLNAATVSVAAYYKKEDEDDSAYQLLGYFNGSTNTITAAELKTKRFVIIKDGLLPAKYTVKIVRESGDNTQGKIIDSVYAGSIRCYTAGRVIEEDAQKHLCIIALKTRATEQLNNVIDTFNFVAQSVCPDYSGSGTGAASWIKRATSNPASMMLHVLRGTVNQEPVDDSLIDWKAFEAWHTWCALHSYECNVFVSNDYTISDMCNLIASTARCEPVKIDSLFSVVQDIAKSTPVQLFTPRNTMSYSQTIAFSSIPDAISVEFINKDADYQRDELLVYNTPLGTYEKEVDKRQTMSAFGITNAAQAFKIARYKYAALINRPRQHTLKLDIEYLACTKGDWIKYSGDTALTGIAYARITECIPRNQNDPVIIGFITDSAFELPLGSEYAARVRKANGDLVIYDIMPNPDFANHFYTKEAITNAASAPTEGDLCVIGIKGKETLDLLVTRITPSDDFSATLTCVDYAPEIFGVDDPSYVVPPFESKVTIGGYTDSGAVNPLEWKRFDTYHDDGEKPASPTEDGQGDGWHYVRTIESKWVSYKTAQDVASGSWSEAVKTSGIDGTNGAPGEPIITPDSTKTVCYLSFDDIVGNRVVNNADKNTFGTLYGGRLTSGISGSALELQQQESVVFEGLPFLTDVTLGVFFKLSSYGIITQQTEYSYYLKAAAQSIVLRPTNTNELIIGKTLSLDSWYALSYSYNNELAKDYVRLFEFAVEPNGRSSIVARNEWVFNNVRDFATEFELTYDKENGNNASGIVDEFRIDGYCWNDEEAEGWAYTKGVSLKRYTAADYKTDTIDKTVGEVMPQYLGALDADPLFAKLGDWYAYAGADSETRTKGLVYKKVSASFWIVDENWAHIMSAMNDLLLISKNAVDGGLPAVVFCNTLVATNALVDRLTANEAFITKLAAKTITLNDGGVIKSQIFESGVTGFEIKSNGDAEFNNMRLKNAYIDGNSVFKGEIDSAGIKVLFKQTGSVYKENPSLWGLGYQEFSAVWTSWYTGLGFITNIRKKIASGQMWSTHSGYPPGNVYKDIDEIMFLDASNNDLCYGYKNGSKIGSAHLFTKNDLGVGGIVRMTIPVNSTQELSFIGLPDLYSGKNVVYRDGAGFLKIGL